MYDSADPEAELRSFYDQQSEYGLHEDDAAYEARKAAETGYQQDENEKMQHIPGFGIF